MAGSVVEGELRCQPVPAGTRLSWDREVSVAGAARFTGPLIGWVGRREERAIWTGLKRLLEGTRGAS